MDDWDGPEPEDLSYLWTATLVLPHPRLLDDAQMAVYFPDYDGRWSSQTQAAMRKLEAAGLELNSNWALTRRDWSCPGCGRQKAEIFRKSENGILLAKLELHHDHLWEEANRRPVTVAGPDWRDTLPKGSPFVVETIRELVTRFNDALVCSECNAADGKAKRLIGTDRRFSFAAEEIREFIKAVPHGDHQISVETARRIWNEEKPGFERRAALLEILVDDMVAGRLQHRMEGMHPARPMFRRLWPEEVLLKAFPEAVHRTDKEGLLHAMQHEFLARSVQKDVVRRKATAAVHVRGPTDDEYAAYVPKANPAKWAEAGDDWTCPCCQRGKRAVLRTSSKKQWSGSIRTVEEFEELFDEEEIALRERLLPSFENELHLARRRQIDVCSDCAEIGPRLRQERSDVGTVYLAFEEMKSVLLEVADNRRHEIDMDLAERLSRGNGRYLAAARAMDAFLSLKATFLTKMEHARRNPEARRPMFEDLDFLLRVQHGIETPEERKELMRRIRNNPVGTV